MVDFPIPHGLEMLCRSLSVDITQPLQGILFEKLLYTFADGATVHKAHACTKSAMCIKAYCWKAVWPLFLQQSKLTLITFVLCDIA